MSNPIIEDLNTLAINTPGLKVLRKLKTKIELETTTGETISFWDHPRNTAIELWDGKSWEIYSAHGMRSATKGQKFKTSWGDTVSATRKIDRKLIFNDIVKSLKFENGLFIINDWIALKVL